MGMMKQLQEATEINPMVLTEHNRSQMDSDMAELVGMGFVENPYYEGASVLVSLVDACGDVIDIHYFSRDTKGGA